MSVEQKTMPDVYTLNDPDAELRLNKTKDWQEGNSKALDILNRFHDEHGCFSDEFRAF